MELMLILLLLYLVGALLILPIWTIIKIRGHDAEVDSLRQRLGYLDAELKELREKPRAVTPPAAAVASPAPIVPFVQPAATTPPPMVIAPVSPPVVVESVTPLSSTPAPVAEPPRLPPLIAPPAAASHAAASARVNDPRSIKPAPVAPKPAINWEQFMGAKLFAWLGGVALFLGVAFFVKYSFEHDLIPPEVRVALGFLTAAALIVGGLKLDRDRYRITAQTLIAAGVVSLYAVTFACNSVYHFAFFGTLPTFLMMVLITTTAFVLAVRLPAQVVAILGMLGGFLTPILLSTGVDNPGGLFGYLALLDIGLVAVALRTRWLHLVPMSAAGTVLMMLGWAEKFFDASKGPVAMIVCLGFSALYLIAAEIARRRELSSRAFSYTAMLLPFVGFGFALFFLDYPALAARAPLYLGFVLLLDLVLVRLARHDEFLPRVHIAAGLAAFTLLAVWTG
ncbi:MAG TPA: DUF2339 domain-containing protein, partial [Lacunisphaera sp.]|nr:DUF2339 domain-containing protein [Lacunisphaera sp.]